MSLRSTSVSFVSSSRIAAEASALALAASFSASALASARASAMALRQRGETGVSERRGVC